VSQAQRLGRSDRYRLLHQFAQDRIGSWWTAKDGILHRTVTVRVVGDELSSNKPFVERLQWHIRELIRPILVNGTLHPRLRHPCIPWILDHSSPVDVTQFLVLPSIQGELLVERLRTGALTYGEAARIAAEAAGALQAAHESNIVHGGLHAGNVILSPDGRPSILDFGIAVAAREVGRRSEDPVDVEMGVSSELTFGSELSAASDVAALGALLYQMLTGRSFTEGAVKAFPRTGSALPSMNGVPPEIGRVCVLALLADERTRPSAGDLRAALQLIAFAAPTRSEDEEETNQTGAMVRTYTSSSTVADSPAANGEADSPREPSVREADATPAESMPGETSSEARASIHEASRGPKAVVAEHGTLNGSVTGSKMDRRLGAGRRLPPTAGGKLSGASTERALRSGALSDGSSQSPEVENAQPVDQKPHSNSRSLGLRRMLGSRPGGSQLIVSVSVIVVVALGGAAIDRFRSDGPIPSRSGASNRPAIVPATENPPEGDLVVVPNTIGLSAREARQRLITDGLQFLEARPTQGTPGVVLGSDPPAGVSVPKATGVILMVGVSPDRWIPSRGVP
jgi:serine/threonine protein kinase